jgi:phosphomannomutase
MARSQAAVRILSRRDTDNGLRTLIEPISFVSADRAHLSEMPGPFQKHLSGGEMNVEVSGAGLALRALEAEFNDAETDHPGRLSMDYPDSWFNARASHIEPLLRLNTGATSQLRVFQASPSPLFTLDRPVEKMQAESD